jgi:toxin ParE1/3/4
MLRVRVRRAARLDFREAVLWYSDIDPELGRDLVRRYKDTIQRAREFPRTGQLTDLPGEFASMEVRRFAIQRFRYQVFAVIRAEEMVIVAIAHERRKPGFWLRRLAKVTP